MSERSHLPALETRTGTIRRHVVRYLHESGASQQTFASVVVEHYFRTVPLGRREVSFRQGGDAYRDLMANTKVVSRMLDPDETTRLPSDLEESVIAALNPEHREALLIDLAARVGSLFAPVLPGEHGDLLCAAAVMTHCGQTVTALVPVLADGHIDVDDLPHLPRAIDEIDALMGRLASLRDSMARVMGSSVRAATVTRIAREVG